MPRVEQVQQKALEEFRQRNKASVKRRKDEKKRSMSETAITFVCLFFLLSLMFLQVAKKMTPKMDISVGNNTSQELSETAEEPKGTIDDRLKLIQFNDALAAGELQKQKEKEIFNEALEEKVVIPSAKKQPQEEPKELNEKVQEIITKNLTEVQTLAPNKPAEAAPIKPAPTAPAPVVKPADIAKASDVTLPKANNYKVLVGKYQTAEQAQLAKSILRDTTLGQNAFVKLVENVYTIQIGSYSTADQARAVVDELTTKSFPARVYYEKPQTSTDGAKNIF